MYKHWLVYFYGLMLKYLIWSNINLQEEVVNSPVGAVCQ